MSATPDTTQQKQPSKKASAEPTLTRSLGYKISLAAGMAAGAVVGLTDEYLDKIDDNLPPPIAEEKKYVTLREAWEQIKPYEALFKGTAALLAVLSGGILLTNYAVKKNEEKALKKQNSSPENNSDISISSTWQNQSPKLTNWQEKITSRANDAQNIGL